MSMKSRMRRVAAGAIRSMLSALNQVIPKNERLIFFFDSLRPRIEDNSAALCSYLLTRGYAKSYTILCYAREYDESIAALDGFDYVSKLKSFYVYLRAKYCFYSFTDFGIRPSKRQIVVNQYHGVPFKAVGAYNGRKVVDNFTYALATSKTLVPIVSHALSCEEDKVLLAGQARNDYLYEDSDTIGVIGIDRSQYIKLILWMPTYRNSKNGDYHDGVTTETGIPLVESTADLVELDEALQELNVLLVIKVHPFSEMSCTDLPNIKVVRNEDLLNGGIELYEFIKDFDAMISDYSSVHFDYMLLDRPIGYVVDDYGSYAETRGFVFSDPLSLMAGAHIRTIGELTEYCRDVADGKDEFREERNDVLDRIYDTRCRTNSRKHLLERVGIRLPR